jgi:zinc and cadmium transporter
MPPSSVLLIYSLLIVLASLAGGWVHLYVHLTHARMQVAISCVAGVMLGVGVLHLLPHAAFELDSLDTTVAWVLLGLMTMFFVERFFCFHHHDAPGEEHEHESEVRGQESEVGGQISDLKSQISNPQSCSSHGHSHHAHKLHWTGAAIGLALHSLMDGVALAASVEIEGSNEHRAYLVGMATFIGIALHKPFDSLAIGTLMAAGGWARRHRHVVNLLFALMIPLGALLFHVGIRQLGDAGEIVGRALAFSAGTFLCISLSDLLPELQFHQHDRIKLSIALLLGLAAAWGIGIVEGAGHGHRHEPAPHREHRH